VKTDDAAFVQGAGEFLLAEGGESFGSAMGVTQAEIDAAAGAAIEHWTVTLGDGDPRLAAFGDVRITSADLAGPALGYTIGNSVTIDSDAAGYGWSSTGSMDLVTVVTHEFGHLLGLEHGDSGRYAVMDKDLESGVSHLLDALGFDADPDLPISDQMLRELASRAARLDAGLAPSFDLGTGQGAGSAIDWNAVSGEGWGSSYSPYAADKAGKDARGNFSDFLVKLFKKGGDSAPAGQGSGYDSLGSSLLGTKPGKGRAR